MRIIILHKNFEKNYSKLSKKIKNAFMERRDIFLDNARSFLLGAHALQGEYKGYKSFNVTGDIRVVYKEIKEDVFLFADIGTHDKLYGR